jgi:putative flippase GtrA
MGLVLAEIGAVLQFDMCFEIIQKHEFYQYIMKKYFVSSIDFFYPPFRNIFSPLTFRYAACGGFNTVVGLIVYFVGFQYVFYKKVFEFSFFAFKPHMAALFLSSSVNFIIGFFFNRYIVFTSSYLSGRIQLFRYFLSFSTNIILNYCLLKLLVEILHWNVFLSQSATTIIIILFSYLTQRHFTFRIKSERIS